MANTTTPAAARRALALSVKRTEMTLKNIRKRAEASGLDTAELAELLEDCE
jgi:hypothetical protein